MMNGTTVDQLSVLLNDVVLLRSFDNYAQLLNFYAQRYG